MAASRCEVVYSKIESGKSLATKRSMSARSNCYFSLIYRALLARMMPFGSGFFPLALEWNSLFIFIFIIFILEEYWNRCNLFFNTMKFIINQVPSFVADKAATVPLTDRNMLIYADRDLLAMVLAVSEISNYCLATCIYLNVDFWWAICENFLMVHSRLIDRNVVQLLWTIVDSNFYVFLFTCLRFCDLLHGGLLETKDRIYFIRWAWAHSFLHFFFWI